jgi:hypothetical protein
MSDKGSHAQEMNTEIQHSKSQAESLSLRGVGQRQLHRSEDHLSDAQAVLFARMRDEGAKICVKSTHDPKMDTPGALNGFLTAWLAKGREITRTPQFRKMPRIAKLTAVRSISGGHLDLIATDSDNHHHFYGLNERGIALLADHQKAQRQKAIRRAAAK